MRITCSHCGHAWSPRKAGKGPTIRCTRCQQYTPRAAAPTVAAPPASPAAAAGPLSFLAWEGKGKPTGVVDEQPRSFLDRIKGTKPPVEDDGSAPAPTYSYTVGVEFWEIACVSLNVWLETERFKISPNQRKELERALAAIAPLIINNPYIAVAAISIAVFVPGLWVERQKVAERIGEVKLFSKLKERMEQSRLPKFPEQPTTPK